MYVSEVTSFVSGTNPVSHRPQRSRETTSLCNVSWPCLFWKMPHQRMYVEKKKTSEQQNKTKKKSESSPAC